MLISDVALLPARRLCPSSKQRIFAPYSEDGPHRVNNGLLLRSDLHKLFDLGYVTVTPDLRLEVSPRLREEWQNGREYYAHHGRLLDLDRVEQVSRPGRDFLRWHNENRFKG